MLRKNLIISTLAAVLFTTSSAIFACGGEASGKHIGSITRVDASNSTFTIRDAETNSPITFVAGSDLMNQVKQAAGRNVMVNYEENDEGGLEALGVAF